MQYRRINNGGVIEQKSITPDDLCQQVQNLVRAFRAII